MNEESQLEKNKRLDTVLSIVIAAIIGFLVNLFANLYYDLFVVHTETWGQVNHTQVYGMFFAFLALLGFLQFFVEDYQHSVDIRGGIIRRYLKYFFYEFTPGKFIRWILGAYLLIVLFGFLVGAYFVIAKFIGYVLTIVLYVVVALGIYVRGNKK